MSCLLNGWCDVFFCNWTILFLIYKEWAAVLPRKKNDRCTGVQRRTCACVLRSICHLVQQWVKSCAKQGMTNWLCMHRPPAVRDGGIWRGHHAPTRRRTGLLGPRPPPRHCWPKQPLLDCLELCKSSTKFFLKKKQKKFYWYTTAPLGSPNFWSIHRSPFTNMSESMGRDKGLKTVGQEECIQGSESCITLHLTSF
jgi:hypothetical protein